MDIMSVLDPVALAAISALALTITQYIKGTIPEKIVPYANVLAGLVAAFLYFYKPGIIPDYNQIITMVVNGVLGATGSHLSYDFLSSKRSPQFSLSSKPTEPAKPEPIKIPPEFLDTIKGMFASLVPPPAEKEVKK